MPGSGSAGSTGQPKPNTEGISYGTETFESANESERIFSLSQQSVTILIRALPGNSGIVYLGWDGDVTVNDGMPLEAGDTFSADLDVDRQNVWGVAASAGDEVRFLVAQ